MLMTAAEAWAFEAMVRCIVCCAAWAAHLVACRWHPFGPAQLKLAGECTERKGQQLQRCVDGSLTEAAACMTTQTR
jgi:hypothetical protein